MTRDDVSDPRAFRWVESGVSGLARPREWDASGIVEVEALASSPLAELEFSVLAGGAVQGDVPPEAVRTLTAELPLEPPYAVRAVRRGRLAWAVAARALRSEPVALALPREISALEVVLSPAGEETVLVDGREAPAVEAPLQPAVEELRRRGRGRFQSFVAHADRVGEDRWELTVDPL